MLLKDFQAMLVSNLRARVRNGEFTERGLARLVGVSQPHLHNILKGARILSTDIGDQILQKLNLSLLDLLDPDHAAKALNLGAAPGNQYSWVRVLEGRLGPHHPWPTEAKSYERFPISYARAGGIVNPVVVRTGRDEAMEPLFAENDTALLDQAPSARTQIHNDSLYVLKRGNHGLIRRLRIGADSLYIVPETQLFKPAEWERISLVNLDIMHIVRARLTFLPQEREWPS
ncbi:MAG: S24 family peptidase [Bryobacteraceae bacterium]